MTPDVLAHYSELPGLGTPGPHQEAVLKPLALTPAEAADLIAFLESLTDAPAERP